LAGAGGAAGASAAGGVDGVGKLSAEPGVAGVLPAFGTGAVGTGGDDGKPASGVWGTVWQAANSTTSERNNARIISKTKRKK
jgi:hypothetical protein